MIQRTESLSSAMLPNWPHFSSEEITAVTKILQSGKVNYWTGEQCRLFEKEFAKFSRTRYAVCLMNGTVALEAALYALGIGAGDEVITTSRTFIASASAVIMRGATPIFADVDANSQNITAATVEKVLTPRTKAIIAVHLAGWPCEMESLLGLAEKHHLWVIEDCAQALGASYQNRAVGSWGQVAAFSFCQDKIITTGGEGGMITTDEEAIYKKIWSFKDHGKDYAALQEKNQAVGFRWLHETFGTNWRMTEMQAAIGRIQLKKLPEWLSVRQRNANILARYFVELPALYLPKLPEKIQHAYYRYYAFVRPERLKPHCSRDTILKAILAAGVPCFVGSCSEVYQEQAFARSRIQPKVRLPVAKKLGESSLAFLVHPTLTEQDMENMGKIITEKVSEASL